MLLSRAVSKSSAQASRPVQPNSAGLVCLVLAVTACTLLAPSEDEFAITRGQAAEDAPSGDASARPVPRHDGNVEAQPEAEAGSAEGDACEGGVRCTLDEIETESQPCGPCNTGAQTRTRTCLAACEWSPWSNWGACEGVTAECSPGAPQSEQQRCGLCGTGSQTRTRDCTATTCKWAAWSAWSGCTGVTAECEPDHWRCCAAGAWEWCRASTCMWTRDCDRNSCANSPSCDC